MGQYLNPSANLFSGLANSSRYFDKTALIAYTNGVMGTSQCLTCSCRPPGSGKSGDARMLAAYYSRSAQTKAVFDRLQIARLTDLPFEAPTARFVSYETYLNQLDVIFFDLSRWLPYRRKGETFLGELQSRVIAEIQSDIPETRGYRAYSLPDMLSFASAKTGRKFFIIIDNYDLLFREPSNESLQTEYLLLLRQLFACGLSMTFTAGAYLTGVLPIAKSGIGASLANFVQCSIIHPRIIGALSGRDNFSQTTKSADAFLKKYLSLKLTGLREAILCLMNGGRCRIDPEGFLNDVNSLLSYEDVLTLLTYFGYLSYDRATKTVSIPNEAMQQKVRSLTETPLAF